MTPNMTKKDIAVWKYERLEKKDFTDQSYPADRSYPSLR